jgi:hypothetical protein
MSPLSAYFLVGLVVFVYVVVFKDLTVWPSCLYINVVAFPALLSLLKLDIFNNVRFNCQKILALPKNDL